MIYQGLQKDFDFAGQKIVASDATLETLTNHLNNSKISKRQILPPCVVVNQGQNIEIKLLNSVQGNWQLNLENNKVLTGEIVNCTIHLPSDLPLGYHNLTLENHCETTKIIITPAKAFTPEKIQKGGKIWGSAVQLYSLKSQNNFGIGDFGDLQQFLKEMAKFGGDFIGLNPIHSLLPAIPENASPYSPSSRVWLNVIYIDLKQIAEFNSPKVQDWFNSKEVQQQITELQSLKFIDYAKVTKLKLKGLKLIFAEFIKNENHQFADFVKAKGQSLKVQASFDALHQFLSKQNNKQLQGWNDFPNELQDFNNQAVQNFIAENSELVNFYAWLQFVADLQLKAIDDFAKQNNVLIGLCRDLAVGVAIYGAETWADKDLFIQNVSVGAPPDIMAPQGQVWELSAMHPLVLQERGYQPFIDLLKANMNYCSALRIDHILGFFRMWLIPEGKTANFGAYLRYPLEDLLNILALESVRNKCLIIAEALGVVPEGLLETLEQKDMFSYHIFYFEQSGKKIRALKDYPQKSFATLSTHDLPTIKGYWELDDLKLAKEFGFYQDEAKLTANIKEREQSKKAIFQALEQDQTVNKFQGVVKNIINKLKGDELDLPVNLTQEQNHKLQAFVAKTNSALFATQPEDWLNMLEPVNIPGTKDEYPNWRRKLAVNIDEIFNDHNIQQLLQEFSNNRK